MLENTHLFPSPLSIQWSFSDCGSSPPTKHRPLPHFTVREWGVYTYMHIYADTRTHAHTHTFLSGLEKSTPEVKFQLSGQPSCLACVCLLWDQGRSQPTFSPLSTCSWELQIVALCERASHLCISSLQRRNSPLSTNSKICVLGS